MNAAWDAALAAQERGDLLTASYLLRLNLVFRPDHAEGWGAFAGLAWRLGDGWHAVQRFGRAAVLDQRHLFELGHVHKATLNRPAAILAFSRLLAVLPEHHQGRAQLIELLVEEGAALAAAGREGEALALYQEGQRIGPGYGLPFTRAACLRLRRRLGQPPPDRVAAERCLAASQLGALGRFGNQLMQYLALRVAARRLGVTAACAEWPGRYLFGLDDPLPPPGLPIAPSFEQASPGQDVQGYAGATAWMEPDRAWLQGMLRPVPPLLVPIERALEQLTQGGTLVALHVRRGDYGIEPFWIAPLDWYRAWLDRLWPSLDRPRLYVASDDPAVVESFAAYGPASAADLPPGPPGAAFLPDWLALAAADHLAIANSTFSFTAAMANPRAASHLRPDRRVGALVPYDPWDADALLP